jgi:iron(III) transport system substrate-binding protein
LPKATQAMLAKMKFDASILSGLDQELAMPPEWIAAAKTEGEVKVLASWDPRQFREMSAPFRERYPFVKLTYTRGGKLDRSIKALIALQQGRFLGHIITSPGEEWLDFKDEDALADLRVLPNFKTLPEESREQDGLWIGQKMAFRCMAYNTDKIKKADLPKTWDDLITNPVWRNGNLAIPDRPNLWLSMLWVGNGPAWTTNFMERLFREVKPQLRKEGSSAAVGLTVAGETPAVIGAAEYRVKEYEVKGAPVSWHCPEPIPVAISQMMMLKGTPSPNGAYMFLNWFLSKEGQIAQYAGDFSAPVHKDLYKDQHFYPYPDEVIGRKLAFRDENKLRVEYPKLLAAYAPLWVGAGGGEVEGNSLMGELNAKETDGRGLSLKLHNKIRATKVSPSRTEFFVNSKKSDWSALEVGMVCEVSFNARADEAAKVECEN